MGKDAQCVYIPITMAKAKWNMKIGSLTRVKLKDKYHKKYGYSTEIKHMLEAQGVNVHTTIHA